MTNSSQWIVAAIDLDDTLLRRDGTISARNVAALNRWLASGRQIVIATGRPHRSVGGCLPPGLHETPLICYNGAEIHINGLKVYENLIPPDAVRTIVEQVMAADPASTIGLEVNGELHLNRVMPARTTPYQVADLLEVARHSSAKVLVFSDQLETLLPVWGTLPKTARTLLSAKYRFAQILAASADKAEALRVLTAEWGVTLDHVVAFGDDTNDVDMIRASGYGVAMANAVDEVIAVADYVTAHHEEDGVALVLERLLAEDA